MATAGEALPAADGGTVLAGWNPDCTYWVCDARVGPGETWVSVGGADRVHWTSTSEA